MKKSNLIIIGVLLLLFYFYLNSPKPKVNDNVHPYIERFFDLLISESYSEIYNTYMENTNLSHENFNKGIDYFLKIFGKPISYKYKGDHTGGVGYYLNYSITFSNGKYHNCSFSFSIKSKHQTLTKDDLENLSMSADYGERQFNLSFKKGRIIGGSKQTGGFNL